MKTNEVVKNIHQCPLPEHTDLTPHQEVAKIILEAANSRKAYISHGFQEEAEGEEPMAAPQEMVFPIF